VNRARRYGDAKAATDRTTLKNYDYLISRRGLDDVQLAREVDTLVHGAGGVVMDELRRPGVTAATEPNLEA
jgi:hypothetical protein